LSHLQPAFVVLLWAHLSGAPIPGAIAPAEAEMSLSITSPGFEHNADMPSLYTCEGQDAAPPLEWSGAPAGTKSLALIVDDPDAPDPAAPKRVWVHWVVFNLPPSSTGLAQGADKAGLPSAARHGLNDWGRTDYGGPCPPIGRHRYFHKLYALDVELDLQTPTKAELLKAMEGHILGTAELIGTYQKKG
jgi:Raf kinase inhibitor-like YbhB/YbcL family protein